MSEWAGTEVQCVRSGASVRGRGRQTRLGTSATPAVFNLTAVKDVFKEVTVAVVVAGK